MLSDRYTLGFARLTIMGIALFAVASIAALFVAGRWMRGAGKGGPTVDDPIVAGSRAERLQEQIEEMTHQRDRYEQIILAMRGVATEDVGQSTGDS